MAKYHIFPASFTGPSLLLVQIIFPSYRACRQTWLPSAIDEQCNHNIPIIFPRNNRMNGKLKENPNYIITALDEGYIRGYIPGRFQRYPEICARRMPGRFILARQQPKRRLVVA